MHKLNDYQWSPNLEYLEAYSANQSAERLAKAIDYILEEHFN